MQCNDYTVSDPTNCTINNKYSSLMFVQHVLTSARSSSGWYIQRHTCTMNSIKDVHVQI